MGSVGGLQHDSFAGKSSALERQIPANNGRLPLGIVCQLKNHVHVQVCSESGCAGV